MKLFVWQRFEYENVDQYLAFADDEAAAKEFVIESIRQKWADRYAIWQKTRITHLSEVAYCDRQAAEAITFFTSDPKWELSVHEIVPGVVRLL